MHLIDWTIIVAYLAWVLYDGVKRARGTGAVEGYFLASRSLPWWAVGLSVMATQMSAITLVGTTGQGYDDGIRFVQFYFGLPVAMIILSVTLVPFFHQARVFTAYEYLERRFDARTRALTSLLFSSRAASAPASSSRPRPSSSRSSSAGACRSRFSRSASRRRSTRCWGACRRSPGPTSSRWSSSWWG